MSNFLILITGLVFGIGLGISGMLDPLKVKGFLDVTGNWDPALMFVMVGGISFHLVFYRLIMKSRTTPIFGNSFKFPKKQKLDWPLIVGSALFGIGWGLSGFCPGPAVVSLAAFDQSLGAFVLAMITGIICADFLKKKIQN